MPGVDAAAPRAGGDDLDRLLDDFDVERLLDGLEDAGGPRGRGTAGAEPKSKELGLETAVEVKKQRKPNPKLDDNLLLTQKGIPKLRKLTRELKFKGKGHEFSDVGRMLNMYQLWLDDLYPRARFADSIVLVEKAGHGKRMQVMRKEWIDEDKPKHAVEETEPAAETTPGKGAEAAAGRGTDVEVTDAAMMSGAVGQASSGREQRQDSLGLFLTDDEDERTFSEAKKADSEQSGNEGQERSRGYDEPAEDELDVLLAGDGEGSSTFAPLPSTARASIATPPPPDDFADEMEAMAEMDM